MEQRQKPRIVELAFGTPVAEIYVDGICRSFSLLSVDPNNREWLLDVLHNQMNEIHERAYLKGKTEIINEHRRLLKLPEI